MLLEADLVAHGQISGCIFLKWMSNRALSPSRIGQYQGSKRSWAGGTSPQPKIPR